MKQLIGFCGPKRAGKNTAGEFLKAAGWTKYEHSYLLQQVIYELQGFEFTDEEYEETKDTTEFAFSKTYRDAYIAVGAVLRRELGKDILSKHFLSIIEKQDKVYSPSIRMVPEAEMVLNNGGIMIEIVKDGTSYDESIETETRLPEHLITYSITNNGSKLELHEKVKDIIEKHGISV
jgi:hypothetical protein